MNGVQTIDSSIFRNNLSSYLEKVSTGGVMAISRFGQKKAILMDSLSFKIQSTLMGLLDKFPNLTEREEETLNILMNKKSRQNLINAMRDIETGSVVSSNELFT
ncbi:MAG: type II toxin-antitoxin system Phd/YefM family antitoxin [Candidatus Beckwithbacteria bacterium]|nr:type II toxin-antitoxin system Phd/YefM family antitoxin [Patescibacteria group bacterium]